jgi:hypothetical protein
MSYRIAGIDVHKRMLAVVVADIAAGGEYAFDRRTVGTRPEPLRVLAAWFVECGVDEVVMESTAQYWRPVWETVEGQWAPQRAPVSTRYRPLADCTSRSPNQTEARAGGSAISQTRRGW